LRLSSPRLLIAGTAAAACAVAGGVAVAATNDSAKPVAKTGAAAPTADPNAQLDVHVVNQSAAQVQAFWTPRRVQAALNSKKVLPEPTGEAAPTGDPASAADGPEIDIDGTSPDASAAAAGGGASAQAVVHTRVWTKHGRPPAKTIGRLIADVGNGYVSLCSATIVNAKNRSTLITAGHCVNRGKGGGWYKSYAFVPDLPKSRVVWPINRVVALRGWTRGGDLRYDIAGARVSRKGGRTIQSVMGSQGIAFNFKHRRYGVYDFGYPADLLPSGKKLKNINLLRYCSGRTYPVNYGGGSIGMGLNCTMGHGASGGPWIYKLSKRGHGRVIGVNSTHSLRTNQMNTPNFGKVAVAVYKEIAK
jgi:hypothetical protein